MSDQQKLVQVPDLGVVQFPGSMPAVDPRLAAVQKQFPRLAPYLSNVTIQQGKKTNPKDDRGLEFYPPWESKNPNPGKITLELQCLTFGFAEKGNNVHYSAFYSDAHHEI